MLESFDMNHHNCLVREAYGGFWPVSGRDFVLFRHLRCRDDGTLLVCAKSVASPACPPVGRYVRGEVLLNALVLQPLGDTVLVGESPNPKKHLATLWSDSAAILVVVVVVAVAVVVMGDIPKYQLGPIRFFWVCVGLV